MKSAGSGPAVIALHCDEGRRQGLFGMFARFTQSVARNRGGVDESSGRLNVGPATHIRALKYARSSATLANSSSGAEPLRAARSARPQAEPRATTPAAREACVSSG